MRFCTCASDSRLFTTNLRRHEGKRDENESSFKRTEVCRVCHSVRRCLWLGSHEPVELAHAEPVRLTSHYLLASPGTVGPRQDPVWRFPRPARTPNGVATPHDGAVGEDVTRGT